MKHPPCKGARLSAAMETVKGCIEGFFLFSVFLVFIVYLYAFI